ncbi:hypothetical protein [Paenibacillus faecalis]|uniref:hypothetical protein n=1 Tax=Paenibacillus faecalis TaxID=2079532 RepID=UPI00131A52AB|nr:hypothetical protein [Paenibacillus faecalis]
MTGVGAAGGAGTGPVRGEKGKAEWSMHHPVGHKVYHTTAHVHHHHKHPHCCVRTGIPIELVLFILLVIVIRCYHYYY